MVVSIKFDQAEEQDRLLAQRLRKSIGAGLLRSTHDIDLHVSTTEGLSISCPEFDAKARLSINLHLGEANHRRRFGGGSSQMIAKAVGIDQGIRPSIVDATAGLGSDAFVFASLGSSVTCIERSPILYAMLEDALTRASQSCAVDDDLHTILNRLTLHNANACCWLAEYTGNPSEVIYLDPMFPDRKKRAAVKKDMRILQMLLDEVPELGNESESQSEQEGQLLAIALQKASHRVVVKRPKIAPPLPGVSPGYQLVGKTTRFDIYPLKSLKK